MGTHTNKQTNRWIEFYHLTKAKCKSAKCARSGCTTRMKKKQSTPKKKNWRTERKTQTTNRIRCCQAAPNMCDTKTEIQSQSHYSLFIVLSLAIHTWLIFEPLNCPLSHFQSVSLTLLFGRSFGSLARWFVCLFVCLSSLQIFCWQYQSI